MIQNFPNPQSDATNPPTISISGLEQEVHQLINKERTKNGLPPLSYDSKLALIARKHSMDMSKRNFFSHQNPDGESPSDRGKSMGYNCRKNYGNYYTEGIAENIFKGHLYHSIITYSNSDQKTYQWITQSDLAKITVNGWMNSPGHRKNILTKTYDKEGIGVGINPQTKEVYITQNFC